jgi:hypothetical protein
MNKEIDEITTKSQLEKYAFLINDSLDIDCLPLVASIDEILKIFEQYLKQIDKVL